MGFSWLNTATEGVVGSVVTQNSNDMSAEKTLIPLEEYLEGGVYLGTKQKTKDMETFIYKARPDGLYLLKVRDTDERIRIAAKLLSLHENILVIATREYAQKPAQMFAKVVGAMVLVGKIIPGTLTNPSVKEYIEPDILLVADPLADWQVISEASKIGIPIIGLCDSNNLTSYIDLIIPVNNKGKRSLAIVYWLLAREMLKEQGVELDYTIDDLEYEI